MKKFILTILLALALTLTLPIGLAVSAEELTDAPSHAEESQNGFAALLEVVEENSAQILSGLAFLGSALVAICYKKGLFPALRFGIGNLSDAVSKIEKNVEAEGKLSQKAIENVNNYVQSIQNMLERFENSLEDFELRMEKIEQEGTNGEVLTLLMREQVELLSDVFLSSSLPQYRKELVGERTARMKECIKTLKAPHTEEGGL